MAAVVATAPPPSALPLWELYWEIPHPQASKSVNAPPVLLESPSKALQELVQDPQAQGRIARFAFPEFSDNAPAPPPQAEINRHDVYMTKGFQHHTFSMQLSSGERVYGHVRRFLPTREGSRVEIGRRGVRALVILTRAMGGDNVFAGMLKTAEGIAALDKARNIPGQINFFLQTIFQHHHHMCQAYEQRREEDRRPLILTVEGVELGRSPLWRAVDTNRFLIPISLLQRSNFAIATTNPMLPLLRCLGVAHTLRLVAALVSERRIILISSSATRLSTCCRSALAVLAQGLLHWQHILIPVLPPHLHQYLQAPFPYLIGVLDQAVDFNAIPELQEVLMIHLDRNELETRNIPTHLIQSRLPDLFGFSADSQTDVINSASDVLAQDLMELLKQDKRTIFGDPNVVGEQAAKMGKAVKNAFGRLRDHGRKLLKQELGEEMDFPEASASAQVLERAVTEDEIYTEGSQNEMGEDEARIAFCTFFLCLYGDLKWYLGAPSQPGETPKLDRDRFLASKTQLGDGEGTPIFRLLQNMCQSQMFEQFVKARVEEIRTRLVVSKDSPLFLVCANYHRQHNIDFSVVNVRRVTRQVAQANPSRLISQANANARRMAMILTSNKPFEGDHANSVTQLVEWCHETSVLMDVMSVMWMRIRDSRGNQWKHALSALNIIRNLLFHGPLAVIAEATDGLDKIRQMKTFKENMRTQNNQAVQLAALEVYSILVDRSRLFEIRRFCANRRREMRDKVKPNHKKDEKLTLRLSFRALHPYLHPQNNRQVAPANIPYQPPPPDQPRYVPNQPSQPRQRMLPQQGGPTQYQSPQHRMPPQGAVQSGGVSPQVDLLGISSPPQHQLQASFGAMSVNDHFGGPPLQPTIVRIPPKPTVAQIPPHPYAQPQPTVAQVPPHQYPPQHQHPPFGGQPSFGTQPPHQQMPFGFASPPPPQHMPHLQPTVAQIPPQPYGQQPGHPGQERPGYGPPGQVPNSAPGHFPPGQVPPGQAPPSHPGYPGNPQQQQQPPNLFAAHPPQYQQQAPQRSAASKFDPFA